MDKLGTKLKEKRGPLSLRAAAKKVGVSHSQFDRYEHGIKTEEMSLKSAYLLSKFLGVKIDDITTMLGWRRAKR